MDTPYFRPEVLLLLAAYVTAAAASVIGQGPTPTLSSTEVMQNGGAWGGRLPVYPVLTNYRESNSTLWSVALSPPFIRRSRRPMPTPPPAEPSEEEFGSPETSSSEDAETNDVTKSSTPSSARHVTALRFPQPSLKRKLYTNRQFRLSTTTLEPATTTSRPKTSSVSTLVSDEATSSEEEFLPYPPPTPHSAAKGSTLGELREPKMAFKNQVIEKPKLAATTTGRSLPSTPEASARPASKYANMRKYFRTKPTTTTTTTSTTPLPADEELEYEDEEEEEEEEPPSTTTTTTTTTKRPTTRRLTKFRTKPPATKRTTTPPTTTTATTTTTTTPKPKPKYTTTTRTTTVRTTTTRTTTTTAPSTTSTTTSTPQPTFAPAEGSVNPVLDDTPFVGEVSAVGSEPLEILVSESNYAVGVSSSEVGASEKDHWGQVKESFVADMEMDEAQIPGEATYLV